MLVKKLNKWISLVMAVAIFLFELPIQSYADEIPTVENQNAVIFVLDSSGSMLSSDPEYRTKESLDMALHILPESTEVGIISFSDQINVNTGLHVAGDASLQSGVSTIQYSGNTNSAVGLTEAVSQLEASTAINKKIILITDGELYLGKSATTVQTATALELLNTTITKSSAQGISIDSLILTQQFDGDVSTIHEISQQTNGAATEYPSVDALIHGIEDVCLPYYEKNLYTLTSVDTLNNQQEIVISIPTPYIQEVRVFFSTYTPVSGVAFQTHQDTMDTISNSVYTFLTIKKPKKEDLTVQFSSNSGEAVKVYYMISYNVKTTGVVKSQNDSSLKSQSNEAVFDILDSETQQSILTSGDFGSFVPIVTFSQGDQTTEVQGTISNGKITVSMPEVEYGEIASGIILESDSLRIDAGHTTLDVIDILTPAIRARQQIIAISACGIIALLAAITYFLIHRKKTPDFLPDPNKHNDKEFAFSGKLDFYVTALSDWEHSEIAPFSFYLHSIKRQTEVPFQEILDECGIHYTFEGARKLIFTPGPDKTLYVKNKGENTVLLRGAVIQRGKNYRVAFGDKLYFTAEDGISEIAIYYRNIARREMSVYRNGAVSYRA